MKTCNFPNNPFTYTYRMVTIQYISSCYPQFHSFLNARNLNTMNHLYFTEIKTLGDWKYFAIYIISPRRGMLKITFNGSEELTMMPVNSPVLYNILFSMALASAERCRKHIQPTVQQLSAQSNTPPLF